MHDVVDLNYFEGHDLQYRILSLYVTSSVLTYDVVHFLHHITYDVAYDVSFEFFSGVQIPCTGPE